MGPNRYVCSVLEEMRDQLKYLNHFTLYRYKNMQKLMIEEAQTLVNRMEAALEDWADLEKLIKRRRKLKKEIKQLELKKETLGGDDDGEESERLRITNALE